MSAPAAEQKGEAPTRVLPAAYAPFQPIFEQLSTPLRSLIGGQLVQFERFIAHFTVHEHHATGEPEGFDGLAQKGDLAHILQSELLLRTEAPLEFIRRLSQAETLFLNKTFVDPGAHAVHRLAISCGPSLLGHARLVALSALFFFCRLATARGGKLYWSFAPRTERLAWFAGLSVQSIRAFLEAASFREMNAQDLESLSADWESAGPRAGAKAKSAEIDWLLIAQEPSRSDLFARVPRALSVHLEAPAPGEARRVRLSIVRNGHVRRRFAATFPDDEHCLAALSQPFAPRTQPPSRRVRPGEGKRPTLAGWEPQYFVSPRQGQFLVRRADGLLILMANASGQSEKWTSQSYWLKLSEDVKLVGAELAGNICYLAVQGQLAGKEAVWIGHAVLTPQPAGKAPRRVLVKTLHGKRFPCRQLFARQAPFAVPSLDYVRTAGRSATYYSSLGQVFRLSSWAPRDGPVFEVDLRAGRIVFDNGAYRAFCGAPGSAGLVRIEKRSGHIVFMHKTADGDLNARMFLGAAFDQGSETFCYSIAPGRWEISRPGAALPAQIHTGAADQIVSIRPKGGGFEVRLWSDARHGGDGAVRLEQHRDDGVVSSRTQFSFEQVGGVVAKYAFAPDGSAWAMMVDEAGEPACLVRCRRSRTSRDFRFEKYDLEDLAARAHSLEPDVAFD